MPDSHKERRLGEASDLQSAVDALGSVPGAHRTGFIYDRLMSSFDDICHQHSVGANNTFTPAQMNAIKDIAFQIVFLLDPKSRGPQTFLGRLWHDFKSSSPISQVGYAVGSIVFVYGLVIGSYSIAVDNIIPKTKELLGYKSEPSNAGIAKPDLATTDNKLELDKLKVVPEIPRINPPNPAMPK